MKTVGVFAALLAAAAAQDGGYDENLALYFVDFAAASYCSGSIGHGVSDWSCKVWAHARGRCFWNADTTHRIRLTPHRYSDVASPSEHHRHASSTPAWRLSSSMRTATTSTATWPTTRRRITLCSYSPARTR